MMLYSVCLCKVQKEQKSTGPYQVPTMEVRIKLKKIIIFYIFCCFLLFANSVDKYLIILFSVFNCM